MKILGIDPGFAILGWAVIDKDLNVIKYGTIETASGIPIEDRLLEIHKKLTGIVNTYQPDCAAIERIFFTKNTKTAIDVAKTIGVILLTFKISELSFFEYTPSQIKHVITGFGGASKDQMKIMIKKIFNIKELPGKDDAIDAMAIAACHSFRQKIDRVS